MAGSAPRGRDGFPEPPAPPPIHDLPSPPTVPDQNAAIQMLVNAADVFFGRAVPSESASLNTAFQTEKTLYTQNNLSIYSNPSIRYTTVARYLRARTRAGGGRTYRKKKHVRKTRKM